MQLGGELMTLRIFRLLKAMIADKLLTLNQEGKITSDPVRAVLDTGLPEEAVRNGKYIPGWVQDVIETESPDGNNPRLRAALNLAERVLPTRWSEDSPGRCARLQTFYALWDIAEDAKKRLGGKIPGADLNAARDPFLIPPEQLGSLLEQSEIPYTIKDAKALELRLTVDQMEWAIRKVVQEAVKIAEGALQRLPDKESLDWLIFSGQSCNLNLVDQEIRHTFQASERFIWNPERVTFLPEYAKLSTAIGACYAEYLRRSRFAPADSMANLRRGVNIMYFDINNLFSYLLCSFHIAMPGTRVPVFEVGRELLELYGEDGQENQCGSVGSEWGGAAPNVAFYRQDYANGLERAWGNFSAQHLAEQLELSDQQWREQIRYQYEVDHRLYIEVLMYCKDRDNPEPRYRFKGAEPRLHLAAEVEKSAHRLAQAKGPAGTSPAGPTPTAGVLPLLDSEGPYSGISAWAISQGSRAKSLNRGNALACGSIRLPQEKT